MSKPSDIITILPQSFFDLLARVIPGSTAISIATVFSKKLQIADISDANSVWLFLFLFASYVVGQLLSPLTKFVQRFTEFRWLAWWRKCNHSMLKKAYLVCSPPFLFARFHFGRRKNARKGDYDRLRFHEPSIGAICAKIRGEFMMHNGLAAVFLVSSIALLFSFGSNALFAPLFFLAFLLSAYRGRATRDTFNQTVEKFISAAKSPVCDRNLER